MCSEFSSSKVRLIDIARRVGVSKRVVGSVLNDYGVRSARISATRRAEILRVASELGYSRNLTAATLAGCGSRKIGVLIDSQVPACVRRMLFCLEANASSAGYCLLIGQAHDSPQTLCQHYESYMQHNVESCVCLAHDYPGQESIVRNFFRHQRNVIFLDSPDWADCWSVDIVRQAGLNSALSHLRLNGREKIAFWLCGNNAEYAKNSLTYRQRLNFFASSGLPPTQLFFRVDIAAFAEEILRVGVDAVIAPNDMLTARLAAELMRRGVKIPDDIALVGHDNDPISEFYFPSLTSISQNEKEVGEKMWELVQEQLGSESKKVQKASVDSTLVERDSSKPRKQ
jgi:DNA-binding LacI/PurR family transcriptional regulator